MSLHCEKLLFAKLHHAYVRKDQVRLKERRGWYIGGLLCSRGKEQQKHGYFAYVAVMCVYVGQLLVVAASRDHPLLNGAAALSLRLTKIRVQKLASFPGHSQILFLNCGENFLPAAR